MTHLGAYFGSAPRSPLLLTLPQTWQTFKTPPRVGRLGQKHEERLKGISKMKDKKYSGENPVSASFILGKGSKTQPLADQIWHTGDLMTKMLENRPEDALGSLVKTVETLREES